MIKCIEVLKGIAMLLVLVRHNDIVFTSYIFLSYAPVLFISGLLYKNKYFRSFIKKKRKSRKILEVWDAVTLGGI